MARQQISLQLVFYFGILTTKRTELNQYTFFSVIQGRGDSINIYLLYTLLFRNGMEKRIDNVILIGTISISL